MSPELYSHARRRFLADGGGAVLGLAAGIALPAGVAHALAAGDSAITLPAEQAQALLGRLRTAGLSLASVGAGRSVVAAGYGWADPERRRPMRADTLVNIASVTKTITATALMQLYERGRFALEDAIDPHLPFRVRNPGHPEAAITFRHLLTHTSSIADGPAYGDSYACGDATEALGDWLRGYFAAGGAHHDDARNFHEWAPGGNWAYSNVAFGLIGHLVETLSDRPYADYCREHVFLPLGMTHSGIRVADIDPDVHATPHAFIRAGEPARHALQAPHRSGVPLPSGDTQLPLCLYGFATPPDGGARTSAQELGRFLQAYLQDGVLDGNRLLRPGTIALMQRDHARDRKGRVQGLAWFGKSAPGGMQWTHGGADPGVGTVVVLDPGRRRGAVVLTNGDNRSEPLEPLADQVLATG